MSDESKKRGVKGRIKFMLNESPAAKKLKEEGPKKVAKTAGGTVKKKVQDLTDKALDAVFPLDNTHMKTRVDHFNEGSKEHMVVREADLPQAGNIVDTFHEKGITPQPFKKENVSSIMNAFEIRERKAPPEGY